MRSASKWALFVALLAFGSLPALVWSQKLFLTEVRALDEDQRGVAADVFRIFGNGKVEWLAKTDVRGMAAFAPAVLCDFNHRIRVTPDAPLRYQQPDYQRCGKTLSFLVKRWVDWTGAIIESPDRKIVESLWKQAETLEGTNKFGSLALVYTELSNRLTWTNSPVVIQLREQSYFYAAKKLNVKNALTFDVIQGASVMSPQMIVALTKFQREEKIDVTGRLDGATLQAIAGKPYSYYLYEYARPLPMGGPDVEMQPSEIAEATIILENLGANAEVAVARGDRGLAVLLYGEMAQRFWRLGKIKEGRDAEQRSYELAADVLRVKEGTMYDPVQDKFVMSEKLVSAVREYQENQGLRVTGRLDYRTLQQFSGKKLSPYMYGVVE